MVLETFIEREEGGERAVLVFVDLYAVTRPDAKAEFVDLVDSTQLITLDLIQAKRDVPDAKYFIGKGKAHEIKSAVLALDAEVVIINHNLSVAQARNLEQLFKCKVIDRTELILDIFAARARSFEGKLQVELAQLEHLRSHLVKGWSHLERQKGGIGLRGPGETQLETDRRLLDKRIKTIRKRLEKVAQQRDQSRQSRKKADLFSVSLVGYTNAGKSTLFNALSSDDVYVADQLFATLDPTLRQFTLPKVGKAILADTVGFIHDLPHDLVASFKSTLEEARQASLLLHVVDASNPHKEQMIGDVNEILTEIGAEDIPVLLIYNKIDALEGREPRIDYDEQGLPQRVWVSAHTGAGLPEIAKAITQLLANELIVTEIVIAPSQGRVRAALYELDVVKAESVNDEGSWVISVEMLLQDYQRLFGQL